MTNSEFSDTFTTLLNSYNTKAQFGDLASNAEVVLDEYEKSVLLTLALDIVIKSYFDGTLNLQGQGFDDSTRRLMDFSSLIRVANLKPSEIGEPFDDRGLVYLLPRKKVLIKEGEAGYIDGKDTYREVDYTTDVLFILNEKLITSTAKTIIHSDTKAQTMLNARNTLYADYSIEVTTDSLIPVQIVINNIEDSDYVTNYEDIYSHHAPIINETESKITIVMGIPLNLNFDRYYAACIADNENLAKYASFNWPADIEDWYNQRGNLEVAKMWDITVLATKEDTKGSTREYVIVPINYKEYDREMSKPYAQPLKKQAWRLFQNMASGFDINTELIPKWLTKKSYDKGEFSFIYKIRYVKRPKPIILEDLPDLLEIDGENMYSECELNPIIHMDILNKAVEIAITTRGGGTRIPQESQRGNGTSRN